MMNRRLRLGSIAVTVVILAFVASGVFLAMDHEQQAAAAGVLANFTQDFKSPEDIGYVTSIEVHDLDDDGTNEIVVGTATGTDSDGFTGHVHIFDALTYESKWKSPVIGRVDSVAVEDLDGDGGKEIIVQVIREFNSAPTVNRFGYVYVFDAVTHVQKWKSPNIGQGELDGHNLVITDLDGDGVKEIIVGGLHFYSCTRHGHVYVFDGASFALKLKSPDLQRPVSIVVADVDDDGVDEIIVGNNVTDCASDSGGYYYPGHVYVFNSTNFVQEWKSPDIGRVGRVIIDDVDGDGVKEIVAGVSRYNSPATVTNTGYVYVFDGISHIQEWKSPTLGKVLGLRVNDVDDDGTKDIVAKTVGPGSGNTGHVYIFNAKTHASKDSGNLGRGGQSHDLEVDDVDKDGVKEIVTRNYLSGNGHLSIIDAVSLAQEWPSGPSEEIGPGALKVADLDKDGQQELLVGGSTTGFSGHLYIYTASPPDSTPPDTFIVSAVDHKGDPVENGGSTRSNSLTFEFTGTDNVGVASFECSLDGSPFAACASSKTYTRLGSGNHTFDVQAIDTSGNIDPSPATFTWIRGTPTQQGTVTGTVIDSSTSLHIQSATVSADTGQNTTSDANGDYTLDGVPTGGRTLTASATGYVAQIQQTTVLDGETVVLNFALEPDTGSGETTWTRQFGTSSADRALGISIDSSGAYVVGYTLGTFPGQPATESGDAFVRKYSADGSEVWTRQFGSFSLADQALAVSVNSSGVYVAGYTGGDAFLRKYSVDGNLVWTSQFGSTTFADKAQGVSVDSSGVYVTGSTFSSDSKDAFVRKYDVDGNLVWTRQFGSTSLADEALAISVDPSGVYVAGYTFSSSSKDAFISKYGADGKEVWTRQFGSLSLADEAVGISVDSSGVYVAVQTIDDFVRKYDLDGNEIWTNQLTDKPRAIFVDSSGVYVTGGGGFVRKYDVDGSEVWTRLSLADELLGVSVDSSGVYVAGRISGDAFAAKLPLTGNMHVASIDLSFLTEGRKIEAVAQVRIVDEEGFPVPGATVTGDWFLNGKLLKEGTFGPTGSDGIVTISSGRINKGKSGDTIGFCVTGVTGSHNYVATGNVETCDSAPKP